MHTFYIGGVHGDYWNLVEFFVKAIYCVNDSTVERTRCFCHKETGIYKKIY